MVAKFKYIFSLQFIRIMNFKLNHMANVENGKEIVMLIKEKMRGEKRYIGERRE